MQLQVMHQLAVTGKKAADVAVLLGGQHLEVHRIERDEQMIARLIELERKFWHYVETDTPPPADGSPSAEMALRALYPEDSGQTVANPVLEVIRKDWKSILFAALAVTIGSGGFFFTNTFMITYVTQYQGIAKTTILDCLFVVTVLQFLSQPCSALLAERLGEGRFLKWVASLCILVPYPMFLLVQTGNLFYMTAGIALAVLLLAALYAVIAGYMAEAFHARVRYSGISIAYQLGSGLTGGLTPLIGTFLAGYFAGQWWPLAIFFSVLAVMSLVGVLGLAHLRSANTRPLPLTVSQGVV